MSTLSSFPILPPLPASPCFSAEKQEARPRKIRRFHHSSPQSDSSFSPPLIRPYSPPPMPSLIEINRKYRTSLYPAGKELVSILNVIFPKRPADLIADYAESRTHPYVIAPELIDPTIPLEESLEQEPVEDDPMETQTRQQKPPLSGSNGTVRFVRFKNDPKAHRWFAIKQEIIPEHREDFLTQVEPPNPKSCFNAYGNSYHIFSRTAGHPNFMKIFGLVVKEKEAECEENRKIEMEDDKESQASPPPFSPYLILENIQGETLDDLFKKKALSLSDQYLVLEQFIQGILFLFENKIIPHDTSTYNLMLTEDKRLKFIDFDMWRVSYADLDRIAENCYELALELFKDFAFETTGKYDICLIFPFPRFICRKENVRGSLTSALEALLEWYKEITEITE